MDGLIHLAVANPFWVWAGVGAVLLAAEVATSTGWLLWPAASAGLVAVISLILPLDWLATGGLFAALTIATSLTARRYMHLAKAVRGGHDINDNVARLVGHHGKTVGAFAGRDGRVFIDGKEWSAELEEEAAISPGSPVEVTGVSGARLRVRPAH